jgi:molybdopterin-binding protein
MPLSARNQLPGTVKEVKKGGIVAHVSVQVGDNIVESVITRASADALHLQPGDPVRVVVKSTDVMVIKD